jgi:type IV pilus assembly protein PilO
MRLGAREILFLMVILGVLASSYFLIFSKANAKLQATKDDTLAKQHALADLRTETTGIVDLNRKIDDLQAAIKIFDSKLPAQRDVDTILQQISQISQSAGLTTRTVKPAKSETTANYSEEPIELTLSGDYKGFYQFMLDLEQLPRLTRVTQMRLTKINGTEGQMTADVTLSIYFAPDIQTSASAE